MLAQQAAAPQDPKLEEVVVTGTAAGAEVRKLEASFAITTLDDTAITEFAPQSTAALLRLVPGVWSESTGGVSGANVMVRGFPGGGDAPYLTVTQRGAGLRDLDPVLPREHHDVPHRRDRGAGRGAARRAKPGVLERPVGPDDNFILREGGEDTEGVVKYTTSDYDLRRFDGYISGPLAEDFYYMVGGYITSSPGLRDAGYNSDEGNQFTINLTRVLDNGKVNVFYRQTDDYGQWYLPVVSTCRAWTPGTTSSVPEPAAPDHDDKCGSGL